MGLAGQGKRNKSGKATAAVGEIFGGQSENANRLARKEIESKQIVPLVCARARPHCGPAQHSNLALNSRSLGSYSTQI